MIKKVLISFSKISDFMARFSDQSARFAPQAKLSEEIQKHIARRLATRSCSLHASVEMHPPAVFAGRADWSTARSAVEAAAISLSSHGGGERHCPGLKEGGI